MPARLVIAFVTLAAFVSTMAGAQPASGFIRPAGSFDRSMMTGPHGAAQVRAARDLSAGSWGATGWFEYDFDIRAPGWYGLIVHGNPNGVEFLVDPDKVGNTEPEARFLGGSGQNKATDRIGNVWLGEGVHRVRVQRHFWTGFPSITAIELKPSSGTLAESIAVAAPLDDRIYRRGQCPQLEIVSGAQLQAERLGIAEVDPYTFVTYRWHDLQIPASAGQTRQSFALPCDKEGYRALWFADSHGSIPNEKLRGFFYEVIDTNAPVRQASAASAAPLFEINCAEQVPDYSGDPTRVVHRNHGSYRESGDVGWTRYQRAPGIARHALPEPSWFAYTLTGLAPQQRYRIEVDYPDDGWRTFGMALRESAPLSYPVAVGVDTGGEFPLSHTMQTLSLTAWPRASDPRLTFMTAHEGSKAACARIRVFGAETPERLDEAKLKGFRRFVSWQEEGANFGSLFGPADDTTRGQRSAIERWAEAASAVGASTLMPTVVVYSFALYPSRFNVAFSNPASDNLRRLMLVAEKYRLGVIPEVHPRSDELAFGRDDPRAIPDNVLLDKNGLSNFFTADGKTRNYPPYFNPLSTRNEEWYVGMIGELADRYKDSPAFEGISLRLMQWANPALNNLVNLDWGYDDTTVKLFMRDTGSSVPLGDADDPKRFAIRHAWLTGPGRQAWVEWRCRKIANLIRRIRDRVRLARPDLKLYINAFVDSEGLAPDFSSAGGPTMASRLREGGIDPTLLNAIDGVVLLNAANRYGRREADALRRGYRDTLIDPSALSVLRRKGEGGEFLTTQNYLEATDAIIPPDRLGFPSNTKRTWAGIVANPSGRLALERYAIQLAETDAVTLGDGGNGYSFGPPIVREFMANFRRLPARRFDDHPTAVDPVTVRGLADRGSYYFYAVNRERYPVSVDLRLAKSATVTRLADDKAVTMEGGRLRLNLRPYELIALKANAATRIEAVRIDLPEVEKRRIARQIAAVEKLADLSPLQTLVRRGPSEEEIRLLQDAAREARRALDRGWLWRARTVLEHSALLAIYKRTRCYPPELRDGERDVGTCPE